MNIKKMVICLFGVLLSTLGVSALTTGVKAENDSLISGIKVGSQEITTKNGNDNMFLADFISYETEKIKVVIHAEKDVELTINENIVTSEEEFDLTLETGINQYTIVAKSKNVSKTYYLNIERLTNTLYSEETRPVYHFTPYRYQMNDPNGLVYDSSTGLFHMFFQCNRKLITGVDEGMGTTGWGHAVSSNLVTWTEYQMAVTPSTYGAAWSGSGVVDVNNTSGLFDESVPPESRLVVFYASVYGDSTFGNAKISMSYSKDGGKTWIKYGNNPVVKNSGNKYGFGLRDPKVIWYQDDKICPEGCWLMITCGDCHIFTSKNLIDWTSNGGVVKDINKKDVECECPDLFELPVNGDENNKKWVFTLGGVSYIVGHFEWVELGYIKFISETETITNLNGIADQIPGIKAPEIYATQTFYSDPLGRRVSISWIRDPYMDWNDKVWNSAQSIPCVNTLHYSNGKYKLYRYPVDEISIARSKILYSTENKNVNKDTENILSGVQSDCFDLVADITMNGATELTFCVRYNESAENPEFKIVYSLIENVLHVFKNGQGYVGEYTPELVAIDGNRVKLRIMLDKTCYDIYGNDGEVAIQGIYYYENPYKGLYFSSNGDATINSMTIYEMSIPEGGIVINYAKSAETGELVVENPIETPDNDGKENETNKKASKGLLSKIAIGACVFSLLFLGFAVFSLTKKKK